MVAFAGRSNVGKSSLINRLTGRKGLARTSSAPGRTREIIFFDVNGQCYFVDLPGYGYAKVSKTMRRQWAGLMEGFFRRAERLTLTILLMDIRRDPNHQDMQMIEWLEAGGTPYIFAVTKCDKVKRNERTKRLAALRQGFGLEDASALVPISSHTGEGISDLLEVIGATLRNSGAASKPPSPKNIDA